MNTILVNSILALGYFPCCLWFWITCYRKGYSHTVSKAQFEFGMLAMTGLWFFGSLAVWPQFDPAVCLRGYALLGLINYIMLLVITLPFALVWVYGVLACICCPCQYAYRRYQDERMMQLWGVP